MGNKDKARKRRKNGPTKFQGKRNVRKRVSDDQVDFREEVVTRTESVAPDINASSSAKKINISNNDDDLEVNESSSHYIIINSEILKNIVSVIGVCPNCDRRSLALSNDLSGKRGLSNLLVVSCQSCTYVFSDYSSNCVSRPNTPGPNPFDINARAIIAFREIGKGYDAMEKVFGLMNVLPIMGKDSFHQMNDDISASYSKVAKACMLEAANDLHPDPEDHNLTYDIGVSCDGTWQKRGFSSLLGAATVISMDTGKCLDYSVLSKKCSICTYWESRKDSSGYESFVNNIKGSHDCAKNHEGSAGAMEVIGILQCFNSSIDKYNLRYTKYLGDGDSKSYKHVCEADPYGVPISKLECIGHIQKRVGRKLRNMKSEGEFNNLYENDSDGEDEDDGKGNKKRKKKGAKLRLTDKMINKLQNYFGIAIRACSGKSVDEMKRDIGASLYHCCEFGSEEQRHIFCPKNALSWCKYQADLINGTNTYKRKLGIHNKIFQVIKPVFMELSSDTLLAKCLHGKTQNANESLNGVIWKKCPKDVYVKKSTLIMSVDSAIINLNEGISRILDVLDDYGLAKGDFSSAFCRKKDIHRIKECDRKASEKGKASRKRRRAIRKGFGDKTSEKEGPLYGAGICEN